MTATLTIKSGVGWSGGTSFSLGTVYYEDDDCNNGMNPVNKPLGTSSDRKSYPSRGQSRNFSIRGRFVGSAAEQLEFTHGLKQISNYHQSSYTTNTTFTYSNSLSRVYDLKNGIICKLADYKCFANYQTSVGAIDYTLTLQEVKNV